MPTIARLKIKPLAKTIKGYIHLEHCLCLHSKGRNSGEGGLVHGTILPKLMEVYSN